MGDITSVTSSLPSLASIPFDWMMLVSCTILLVLVALYAGSSRVIAIALAALITSYLTPLPQHTVLLSRFIVEGHTATVDITIFFALFLPLMLFFHWMMHDVINVTSPIQALLAGVAGTIICVLVILHTPGLGTLLQFGAFLTAWFAEGHRLWLTLLGLVMLAFSR